MRSPVSILALVIVTAASAHESELLPPPSTVGLIRLPGIFGQGACDRHKPTPVQLFSEPRDARPIGQIKVTQPWVFAKEGGCSGLEVRVYLRGAQAPETLPTLEYEYEAPAAIAVAKAGRWCQVHLRTGAAWIRDECEPGFISVEALMHGKGLTLLEGAIEHARAQPGDAGFSVLPTLRQAKEISGKLISSKTVDGQVWVHVIATHVSECEREPTPLEVQSLWLPLRDTRGQLQVWFHPRGC